MKPKLQLKIIICLFQLLKFKDLELFSVGQTKQGICSYIRGLQKIATAVSTIFWTKE